MTTFFIDLWHDLRERRLWPVAVGLLAAIVAVPAILFKPVSDAAPPTAAAPKPTGTPTLPVVSVESGPIRGSKLEAFSASEKNPFKPMKDLAAAPATAGSGTSGPGASAAASGSDSGSGSGSGSLGGSSSSGSDSNSSSGGGAVSGGSPSGNSGSGGSTPSGSSTPTTEWFRYAADFSFGKTGEKAKTYKSAANFTLLPDDQNPAVVFLGAGADGKTAMFFVADPGFTADGEGDCNATGADCRYVTLKVGESTDEETFSAVDGSVSYDLKLVKIDRESLGSGTDPATPPEPKNGKTLAATGAGVTAATETTQDVLPAAFAAGPGVAAEQR